MESSGVGGGGLHEGACDVRTVSPAEKHLHTPNPQSIGLSWTSPAQTSAQRLWLQYLGSTNPWNFRSSDSNMKLFILFSTILLVLTQNNLHANAYLSVFGIIGLINTNSTVLVNTYLETFKANEATEQGIHNLQKCFSILSVAEKAQHMALEVNVLASPACLWQLN
ncbi:uncharacterized protein ACOB8E_010072 isoform 1-T1 [Sarcophilus harrisii]